jgi:integrase
MPRPATGTIDYRNGRWRLRFTAAGQRRCVTLSPGATRAQAEEELANVLADVRRGIWQPPTPAPVIETPTDPTFHEWATDWFEDTKGEWRENTRLAYDAELQHLLRFFHAHRLSQITVGEVDRYKQTKLAEAQRLKDAAAAGKPVIDTITDKRGRTFERKRTALGPESINKTLVRLGQILEVAVERGLLASNPAKVGGKRRRVRAPKPVRVFLDRAEQIVALLDAAGRLDAERTRPDQRLPRRAMVATLVFAGLRPTEQLALDWRDVDLAAGRLRVRASKTDAGVRSVQIVPVLRDVLDEHKQAAERAGRDTGPDGIVFPSTAGTRLDHNRLNKRVMRDVVAEANRQLVEDGQVPLPGGLTPRSMRYTFASVLYALGRDPRHVMAQMGHTDPKLALRIYAQVMDLSDAERERLRILVEGGESVPIGTEADSKGAAPVGAEAGQAKVPANTGNQGA